MSIYAYVRLQYSLSFYNSASLSGSPNLFFLCFSILWNLSMLLELLKDKGYLVSISLSYLDLWMWSSIFFIWSLGKLLSLRHGYLTYSSFSCFLSIWLGKTLSMNAEDCFSFFCLIVSHKSNRLLLVFVGD